MRIAKPSSADYKTVTNSSAQFDTTLAAGELYELVSTTHALIAQGADPQTAAAADANMVVAAGVPTLISGDLGAKVAIIRVAADGVATLTRVRA